MTYAAPRTSGDLASRAGQRVRWLAARSAAVLKVEAVWLAVEPLDMRSDNFRDAESTEIECRPAHLKEGLSVKASHLYDKVNDVCLRLTAECPL